MIMIIMFVNTFTKCYTFWNATCTKSEVLVSPGTSQNDYLARLYCSEPNSSLMMRHEWPRFTTSCSEVELKT